MPGGGRPSFQCAAGADKEASTFSAEGLAEYRARYNPVNGTRAAFTYGQAGAQPLTHSFSHKASCYKSVLFGGGGAIFQCMYDTSAQTRTINCGSGCQTYQGGDTGEYYADEADECECLIYRRAAIFVS